jgi:hypothetical protein
MRTPGQGAGLALALLLGAAGPAAAQEAPQALIARAIKAHGGAERLRLVRADWVQFKGTIQVGASGVPFVNETTVQLPAQLKSVVRLTVGGKTQTVVHLLDGDRASILIDGQPQTVSAAHLAQLRQTLQLDHAVRLVPLLNDPAFSLAAVGGEPVVNGRPALAVQVRGRGQKELLLYFDKATALLVKTEHLLDAPGGGEVRQEGYYSDFKDVGGFLRPGKVAAYRDGKKVMEAELIQARVYERLDAAEFSRP